MFKKKKHPYEYINESNFDTIKTCIVNGMTAQKTPKQIVDDLIKLTDLPEEVCLAIISNEIGGVVDG